MDLVAGVARASLPGGADVLDPDTYPDLGGARDGAVGWAGFVHLGVVGGADPSGGGRRAPRVTRAGVGGVDVARGGVGGADPERAWAGPVADAARAVLHVEVHDSGPGLPRLLGERPGLTRAGRGLRVVAALSDAWGVRHRDIGKIVWCDFTL